MRAPFPPCWVHSSLFVFVILSILINLARSVPRPREGNLHQINDRRHSEHYVLDDDDRLRSSPGLDQAESNIVHKFQFAFHNGPDSSVHSRPSTFFSHYEAVPFESTRHVAASVQAEANTNNNVNDSHSLEDGVQFISRHNANPADGVQSISRHNANPADGVQSISRRNANPADGVQSISRRNANPVNGVHNSFNLDPARNFFNMNANHTVQNIVIPLPSHRLNDRSMATGVIVISRDHSPLPSYDAQPDIVNTHEDGDDHKDKKVHYDAGGHYHYEVVSTFKHEDEDDDAQTKADCDHDSKQGEWHTHDTNSTAHAETSTLQPAKEGEGNATLEHTDDRAVSTLSAQIQLTRANQSVVNIAVVKTTNKPDDKTNLLAGNVTSTPKGAALLLLVEPKQTIEKNNTLGDKTSGADQTKDYMNRTTEKMVSRSKKRKASSLRNRFNKTLGDVVSVSGFVPPGGSNNSRSVLNTLVHELNVAIKQRMRELSLLSNATQAMPQTNGTNKTTSGGKRDVWTTTETTMTSTTSKGDQQVSTLPSIDGREEIPTSTLVLDLVENASGQDNTSMERLEDNESFKSSMTTTTTMLPLAMTTTTSKPVQTTMATTTTQAPSTTTQKNVKRESMKGGKKTSSKLTARRVKPIQKKHTGNATNVETIQLAKLKRVEALNATKNVTPLATSSKTVLANWTVSTTSLTSTTTPRPILKTTTKPTIQTKTNWSTEDDDKSIWNVWSNKSSKKQSTQTVKLGSTLPKVDKAKVLERRAPPTPKIPNNFGFPSTVHIVESVTSKTPKGKSRSKIAVEMVDDYNDDGDEGEGEDDDDDDETDSNVPGVPGLDYPILGSIPVTHFDCSRQQYPGFYADMQVGCQVYHSCSVGSISVGFHPLESNLIRKAQPQVSKKQVAAGRHSFLCPNGTIFSQEYLTCDWWYNVKCAESPRFYPLNRDVFLGGGGSHTSTVSSTGSPASMHQSGGVVNGMSASSIAQHNYYGLTV